MNTTAIVDGLSRHDTAAMLAFTAYQKRELLPALRTGCALLQRYAFDAMITPSTVSDFMAFKTPPDGPTPLPAARVHDALEAAVANDVEAITMLCSNLTLDELYSLTAFARRFHDVLNNGNARTITQ